MSEPFKMHRCSSMPKSGVEVAYSETGIGGAEAAWILTLRREATEQDLEDSHILEIVGDTIWETMLEISHCPFCGDCLGEIGNSCKGIMHLDHTSWNVKRQ